MSGLHIGERIQKSLEGHGFRFSGADMAWCAMRNFPELAGQLSNGNRMVRIRISENRQWIEKIDGWGNIERQLNMREYYGPNEREHAKRIVNELIGGGRPL